MEKLKTGGIVVLVLLIAIQAFLAPMVYLSFKIQQDFIAKNLCEQRNNTISICYGSCVLKKRMDAVNQDQLPGKSGAPKLKLEVLFFPQPNHLSLFDEQNSALPMMYRPYLSGLFPSDFVWQTFDPPQA